ncbi:GlcG/HbpS family heme-binding protein [Acinetobacter sp. 226]|uniref:GlcG/HbpS family heme-binding protein n=1 Tax=Acinetobacter sp. 226 TaxID=3114699 RepID=UPI003A85F201
MKISIANTTLTLLSSVLLLSSVAHAEFKTAPVMSLEVAKLMASNVMLACQQQAKPAAVVILDQGGNLLASQRHESVGIHNLIAAERKAFTAYSTKTSTLDFMRNAQKNPDAQNLNSLPELLLLGGGVPVIYQNQIVGAVGVAGAGGSVQDHQCANSGIQTTLKQL